MPYQDFEGKTAEEAIEKALKELNLGQDEIRTEILKEPSVKAKFFGFSLKNVKVRVFYHESGDSSEDASTVKESAHSDTKDQEFRRREPRQEPQRELSEIAVKGRDFIQKILNDLELAAEVSHIKENDEVIRYILSAQDPHLIIGKRGILLESVQALTYMVANKNMEKWKKILIDVDEYRRRRERKIREEIRDIAYRVRRSGKPYLTDSYSPYDRRIIHMVIQDMDGVTSESEGNSLYKRVWIKPE